MQIEEIIEVLKTMYPKKEKMVDDIMKGGFDNHESEKGKAIDAAIEILKRQIKQKTKTYNGSKNSYCPNCKAIVREVSKKSREWCSNCGQKLDWREEE